MEGVGKGHSASPARPRKTFEEAATLTAIQRYEDQVACPSDLERPGRLRPRQVWGPRIRDVALPGPSAVWLLRRGAGLTPA